MFTSQEHAPTPPSGADLGRFAPPLLRRALGMPGTGPAVEAFQAAVLFADVSGFTALATAMAARGQAGAEALKEHLDRCFGEALRLVQTGFEQGKFGFIDLADTQRTTAEVRLTYQQKLLEMNIAQAELAALLQPETNQSPTNQPALTK